jgi:hypothetical protein
MEMYYIYLKKDLEVNPQSPKVTKSYRDYLAAQSYARKMSNAYDVVMLKVDSDHFNPRQFNTAIMDDNSIYYQEGILDVTFYAQKQQIRRRPTYIRYNPHCPYSPLGFFDSIRHNLGLLMRMCMFAYLAYIFIDAVQAGSIMVIVPHGTGAGTPYDVGSGAKYIMSNIHEDAMAIYDFATNQLSNYHIEIKIN